MRLLWFLFLLSARYSQCSEDSQGNFTEFLVNQVKKQSAMDNTFHFKEHGQRQVLKEYDFIIIGSGSAGSVLANRLSEVAEWNILLLEVGREPTGFSDIPFLAPALQFTDLNWGYKMEKQEGIALGMVDQRMPWPRGRALGGSTVINYMLYVRGNKEDYNRWEKLGNPGWGYKDVFKYFVKSEDGMIAVNDTGYHAIGGYQSVQDVPFRTESANAWVRACQEAGYKYVDYNGKQQLGVSYVQGTIINGRRCSVEKAFLRPVKKRPNLTILTEARATQILINPDSKEAYGVKYVRKGKEYTVLAKKEIISSAGTFHSPQLLMLSGIGPKETLQKLDIPVIQDLQVGQKMYDHITFVGLIYTVNETIVYKQEDLTTTTNIMNFLWGNGPATSLGGVEAFTYMETKVSEEELKKYPDIEVLFLGGGFNTDNGLIYRKTFGVTDEIYDKIWKPLVGKNAIMLLPMLLHPKSYGHVEITSKSPFDDPKLHGNYFTDKGNSDIRTFVASIREIQRIMTYPSMQRYDAKIHPTPIPGCEQHEFDSDNYWECALRHITPTLHHQVSTCKMGPKNDPEAVVDAQLRVYGVKKLRVADCSVIPLPLAAHTNAPSMMIGEKLSDILKEDWKYYVEARYIDSEEIVPPSEED